MAMVGSFEARTHLSALLRRVEEGEEITLTRRGAPIAMLVRIGNVAAATRRKAIQELREFGQERKDQAFWP